MRGSFAAVLAVVLGGCASTFEWPAVEVQTKEQLAADGVTGDAATARLANQEKASLARADAMATPRDETAIIWFGRRLAYLGRYEDAIGVYSHGLDVLGPSPRLLRHRGHRYISLRRFDDAIADFAAAAELIQDTEDEVEPDGQPNRRNVPTSTLHTNIWYHYGLAHYCKGEFARALSCYEFCLTAAKNRDMESATRYWYYLAAVRAGRDDLAKHVLEPVEKGWDVIENHAYYRLLLLYKGVDSEADWREWSELSGGSSNAAAAHGIARYRFMQRDEDRGQQELQEIVDRGPAAAFGVIAAEADLAR